MSRLRLFLILLTLALLPHAAKAQAVLLGQPCGAGGLTGITPAGVPVTCEGSPLVWTSPSGGGGGVTGGGVGPITTAWYASPNCGTNPNCSPVNANTHWVCDATTTNTSNIVTAPDGNFLITAKQGQIVWVVNSTCNGANGPLAIAETTIQSVDSATQIHTTANATASVAGVGALFWGTLDTPSSGNCATGVDNVKTATNAALAAGVSLYLPSGGGAITTAGSGGIMVECSEFQSPTSSTATNPLNLIGHVNSYIIATPNFDFTSIPAGNTGALGTFVPTSSNIPNVSILRDVAFMCSGFNNWGTGISAHPIIYAQRIVATNVTGWGCGATGIINGFEVVGPSTVVAGNFDNFGTTTCLSQSTGQNQTVVFTGTGYCSGPVGLALGGVGNWTASYGTFYQAFGGAAAVNLTSTNQVFNSFGDIIECETNNNTICVRNANSGGRVGLHGTWVYSTTETAAAFGLIYNAPGATTSAFQSTIQGAGGILLGGGGITGIFNDFGSNSLTGGTICAASACSYLNEANSSNGVLVTAAKLVLSANWGTGAANSALSGGNAPIQFTITNGSAATGASPTITYTFPTPYIVAPFSCTAAQTGGTNATGTFTSSALSTTGVTFTFSLTPTANSTEIVQVQCVTP